MADDMSIYSSAAAVMKNSGATNTGDKNILGLNEKLPVSKFRYFGKHIVQLFAYCFVHVSGQGQASLER